MILRYYGHSLFTLALSGGLTLATDPYGALYDYPPQTIQADVVTVSHHHHDHDAVSMIAGRPIIIDREGVATPAPNVKMTGIPSKHDAVGGASRGNNLMFVLETEGLRIAHLGDLGHLPTPEQARALGTPDVLLIPVGGTYTLDAAEAVKTVRLLKPRIAIPMHYRTRFSQAMPIETEEPFLRLMGQASEPMPLCRLTREDLSERPCVLRLSVTVPPNA